MWKTNRAFSLVELLVVMGVIGVLASVVTVMTVAGNVQKGNDARRKADLESIRSALELYYNDHGYYPPSGNTGGWCTQISNPTYKGPPPPLSVKWDLESGGYMKNVPQDPVYHDTNKDYFYQLGGPNNNQTYLLDAYMDVSSNQTGSYNRSGCAKSVSSDPNPVIYNYEVQNP